MDKDEKKLWENVATLESYLTLDTRKIEYSRQTDSIPGYRWLGFMWRQVIRSHDTISLWPSDAMHINNVKTLITSFLFKAPERPPVFVIMQRCYQFS